ncbi:MAG: DUF4410 domain-containing protein [Bradyrhizobiaceae bacterium]|nr:DUF4410 domain-containing protein [Bradyrhizobiaceae bacterium]
MARMNVVLRRAGIAVTAASVLASAGCASTNANVTTFFGGGPSKPRAVVVSDFGLAPGTVSVEGGLAPVYRRKLGKVTPDQLKAELTTAVNEEMSGAMVAALVDGGLPATTSASADGSDSTVVVTGNIRKVDDKDRMKRRLSGLAPFRANVLAEVQISQDVGGARKELLSFVGEPEARKPAAPATTASTAPETTASVSSEKLTPAVASEARRIGKASATRILAFAAEQGWIKPN